MQAYFDNLSVVLIENVLLESGQHALVVKNRAAFDTRYGSEHNVVGEYASGKLSNGGEQVRVQGPQGGFVHEFSYDDRGDWPRRADGRGSTLEVIDTSGNYNDPTNWRASRDIGGTPGSDDQTAPTVTAVIRNDDTDSPGELTSLAFQFSNDVSASLSIDDLVLLNETTNTPVDLTGTLFDAVSGRWDVAALSLPPGRYQATLLAAGVRDAAGNSLDGDGDGSGGGDYTMPLLVALPGDANLDGKVDAADLNIVALHWQMSVEGWNHGDFTKDGIVNDADRTEVAVHWQQDIPRLVAAAGPVGFVRRVPRSPFQRPSYAIESNAL